MGIGVLVGAGLGEGDLAEAHGSAFVGDAGGGGFAGYQPGGSKAQKANEPDVPGTGQYG